MSQPNTTKLDELMPKYYEHKKSASALKEVIDAENTEIKALLNGIDADEYSGEQFTAKIITKDKTKFNTEKLLETCREFEIDGLIKTREYVDEDVLEQAIYANTFSEEQIARLNACREIKFEYALTVKPTKKPKED